MTWNGSGTYLATDGTYNSPTIANSWQGDGDPVIHTAEFDLLIADISNGINAALAKNGENAATANLNIGGFRLTNIAASANSDAGTFGKQVASGAYDSGNDKIVLTLQDSATIDIDTSGLSAGTGGVDLTTAQTVAGIKTFSSISSLAHAKLNGPTTCKVESVASGATPTFDGTATDFHFITVAQNQTWTITWPTAASDTQLGANWVKRDVILARWSGASYTITLDATMLSSLDDYEVEGTHTTGSGEMSTLTCTYWYLNGTKYAQFAWVATAT